MRKEYDYSVSVTRVCAMAFIIICHIGSHFNMTAIGQFFNVGVPIFFLISGYLYGDKEIGDIRKWLYKRFIRIYIPLLLWGGVVLLATIIRNEQLPSIRECVLFLLNLQGLNFILYKLPTVAPGPWFFTVIMFCYLVTAGYHILKKHIKGLDEYFFDYGGIFPLILVVILAYIGINLNGLLAYMVGFGLKKRRLLEEKRTYNIFISLVVFTLAVAIRLITKRYIDGSVLYDQILAPVTHIMIAAAFFIGVRWLFSMLPSPMNAIASSYSFKWLDTISIYVYICHTWFLDELFIDIFAIKASFLLGLIVFLGCVLATSSAMFVIGDMIIKHITKRIV